MFSPMIEAKVKAITLVMALRIREYLDNYDFEMVKILLTPNWKIGYFLTFLRKL